MAMGSAVIADNVPARSGVSERVRTVLVRPFSAFTEAELCQKSKADDRKRDRDGERDQAGVLVAARQIEHHEQIEKSTGGKERDQHPVRHVAVMGAFYGHGEFRIGESEIDD